MLLPVGPGSCSADLEQSPGPGVLTVENGSSRGSAWSAALERATRLEEIADALVVAQRPASTRRALELDWRTWTTFCAEAGCAPLEPSPGALAVYAGWLATSSESRTALAPATVARRLSGVLAGWRAAGVDYPQGVAEKARVVAAGHVRRLLEDGSPLGRGQAPAVSVLDLERISRCLPDTLGGIRDRALLLVGFGIAARRSELAHLEVSDVLEDAQGLTVRVRVSKTSPRDPGLPQGRKPQTCPVAAWRAWLAAAQLEDGPAFRAVDRHGRLGGRMSPRAVGEAVTRAAHRAGLKQRLTGHSLRAGLATEAYAGGVDVVSIARQGGWVETSRALYGYIRTVDKWKDNAARGTGL